MCPQLVCIHLISFPHCCTAEPQSAPQVKTKKPLNQTPIKKKAIQPKAAPKSTPRRKPQPKARPLQKNASKPFNYPNLKSLPRSPDGSTVLADDPCVHTVDGSTHACHIAEH